MEEYTVVVETSRGKYNKFCIGSETVGDLVDEITRYFKMSTEYEYLLFVDLDVDTEPLPAGARVDSLYALLQPEDVLTLFMSVWLLSVDDSTEEDEEDISATGCR